MTNEEIIKKGIRDSIVIKIGEGEEFDQICESLSNQLYKYITKAKGFTSKNVSRGMRGFLIEENRELIKETLCNIYFDFVSKNNNLKNKYDNYVKDIIESSGNLDKLSTMILKNEAMIYRMRRSLR